MTSLSHPVTGHEIRTDEDSADFWRSAGYREVQAEKPKASAKRPASKKSSK